MEILEKQIEETEKSLIEGNVHGASLGNFQEIVLENQLVIMKTLNLFLNIDLKAK